MNKVVSLLKSSIVKNDKMIETKRIETFNKVKKVCNSPEMKMVLKDTGFTMQQKDALFNQNRDLDIKFNYGSDIHFWITHHFGKFLSNSSKHTLSGFGATDLDIEYSAKDNYKIEYNDKDADFAKLTKWYDIFNQYEKLIDSKPMNTIEDILNEYVKIHNELLEESEFFTNSINAIEEKEINDTINDLLENGGDLECGIEKRLKYTRSNEYILIDHRNSFGLDYKNFNGSKDWDVVDSIVVGEKIKGKQSWEVELYCSDDDDINNSIYKGDAILTKNQLSDLIRNIVKSNQAIDDRTNKAIKEYEDYQKEASMVE